MKVNRRFQLQNNGWSHACLLKRREERGERREEKGERRKERGDGERVINDDG